MKKVYFYISLFTIALVLGFLCSSAECDSEIIEKLEVIAIVNMEMRPDGETGGYYIDMTVGIENKNEQALKFRENEFDFFLSQKQDPTQKVYIGPDTAYSEKDLLLEPNSFTEVTFSIRTGTKELTDLETGIQVLNFVGNPSKERSFFIEGKTTLGVKSEKGWSYGEAVRLDWMLCPRMKPELPLHECFYGVPKIAATPTPAPRAIACDQLVKVGRNIVIPRQDQYVAEMGKTSGTFQLRYETYTEPDRIVIEYEGETLYDTGCVGSSGTKSLTYEGNSTTVDITVYSRCDFVGPSCTDWDFTVHCP